MAERSTPLNDAHGHEEHTLAIDQPLSSSMKSVGKAIQADAEEHNGAASSTQLISKANADNMSHVDVDRSLSSTLVPKKNQPPKIQSYLNDTQDHSLSRDEGRDHNLWASKYGLNNNTQTGESSTTRSSKVVQDDITSPCDAELAEGTAAASHLMRSVIPVDPTTKENVNSLAGLSPSTPSLAEGVHDAPSGCKEHTLAIGRPPSSCTKNLGKATETYDEEHDRAASSTKIVSKAIADAAIPSVPAPAQLYNGTMATIGGLAQGIANDSAAPPIRGFAQCDVDGAIVATGGGIPGDGGDIPAQIHGGNIVGIAARAPLPVAIPVAVAVAVAVLPLNPGVDNIDPLINSGIRARRNPTDGDEGKIWEKLNEDGM